MPKLLVIDDDYSLFSLLSEFLSNSGFACGHAPDADAGLAALSRENWDGVILDVMLPGKSGHEILREIRANPVTAALPILMLTARGEEEDKVLGLELGADDYMAKPFGAKELVARLRALLRRTGRLDAGGAANASPLQLDGWTVDFNSFCLVRDATRVQLTISEVRLLELFIDAPGKLLERETLYQEVLGHRAFPQDRSLDMLVSRLRKKLGPRSDGGERIRAVRGKGYVFLLAGDVK